MKIITGFETELKEEIEDTQELNEEFIKVFKALDHDIEVAENVFARASKRAFRDYTEGGKFTEAKDARALRPTWLAESTVVLPVKGFDDVALVSMAAELRQLVVMLGESFKSTADDPAHLALIDPLKCRIQRISEHDYKFTIKQMWAPQ
jgi:hypothetical protein